MVLARRLRSPALLSESNPDSHPEASAVSLELDPRRKR